MPLFVTIVIGCITEREAVIIDLPILLLPVTPQLALSLRSLSHLISGINSSSDILQPTDAAGKFPYLLFSPNRELPSRRNDAENRYLSLKE